MRNWDYQSVFTPLFHGLREDDWKEDLRRLSAKELKQKLKNCEMQLEEWRGKEPPKKRGRKDEYRRWVHRTHDMLDELNYIADELRSRREEGG